MVRKGAAVSLPVLRRHVLVSLGRYWPRGRKEIAGLPMPQIGFSRDCEVPDYALVALPDWGEAWGVDGSLLVPRAACLAPDAPRWQDVDWLLAAFLMLECWPERTFELCHGPVHSFSSRLKEWDSRVWERAWVNRIALFLRTWAAREAGVFADDMFGNVPKAEIHMTHDVDAVAKTLSIRIKQCIFNVVNFGRYLAKGDSDKAIGKIKSALGFLFNSDDWWTLDSLLEKEACLGIGAQFNFYADTREKNFKRWLFDPGYDVGDGKIREIMTRIIDSNGTIGLHPTHDSWNSPAVMNEQVRRLEQVAGVRITACRQHWLCFSWGETWSAQERSGLELDSTLMFNDRPGLRGASAIAWRPWNQSGNKEHGIKAMPTVFMDSQFYDYQSMDSDTRLRAMQYWMDEIYLVGGQAAVLWHPHTLTEDYGWGKGFDDLLKILLEKS